jgi:hypothetical protein
VTPRRLLLVGTAALLALRVGLSLVRTGPLIVADEVGYLTNARLLAGGIAGQMSTAPFSRGGYSILLAPLLALDGNPATSYRLVLILNALLAASLGPLLYLLLTRCFHIAPRAAVWPVLAAAAYPSVTIYTQVALSENLLIPLFVLWLLCFGGLLDAQTGRQRFVWGAATAVCAVALWAAHGRMSVVLALTALAFVVLAIARRQTLPAALLGLVLIAVGLAGVHVLNDFLIARSYGGHAPNEVGQRLSTVESVSGVAAFLRNLVGQAWYLMVATLGVAIAVLGTLRATATRSRASGLSSQDVVLGLIMLTALGLLVVSALSFPDVARPDMLIYGRYTEVVLPPVIALGLVQLASGRMRHAKPVLIALMVATLATALLRFTVAAPSGANRWNVASLPFFTFHLGPAVIVAAGIVATLCYAALIALRRRAPTAIAPLLLVLFLATTAVTEHNPVLTGERSFYPGSWTSPGPAAAGARTIAFDTDHGGGLWVYQWFASDSRFVLFSGSSEFPPARFVLSSPAWAAAHARLRPTALWTDRSRDRVLFRLARTR